MSDNQLAVAQPPFVKASTQLSQFLGIETSMMIDTLKAQCFKGLRPEQVTDAQLAAFVSTANALQVNPLLPGFLYAYPERNGGITPILGPDGVLKKLDEFITSGKLEGYECTVYPEDVTQKPTHAIATIHRHGSTKPATYTAIFSEWVVGQSPTWNSKPRHMLWIRAIKQAARQVIHGLPMDADEYKLSRMLNVTESDETPAGEAAPFVERAPVRERAKRGAAAAKEVVVPADEPKALDVPLVPDPVLKTEQGRAAPIENIQQAMEARQEKVAPKAEEKPAEPRAFLKDGEKLTTVVTLQTLSGIWMSLDGKRTACLKGNVTGGFVGEIRTALGSTELGPKNDKGQNTLITANPPFVVGKPMDVVLHGKLSKAPAGAPGHGTVINWIESATAVQAEEVA